MAFTTGDPVYVRPIEDTGEVHGCFPPTGHDVLCDAHETVLRFEAAVLEGLPFEHRELLGDTIIITREAKVLLSGRRVLKISHYIIGPNGHMRRRSAIKRSSKT